MDQKRSDSGIILGIGNSCITNLLSVRSGHDSETESVTSDYSEMADPVKEHLANVQIIADPLSSAPFVVQPKLFRLVGEGEEEFLQRIQKMNFLSLAQEFAELKKQNASALPFNLHEDQYKRNQDSEDEVDEFSTGSRGTDRSEGENDSGWQDDYDDLLNGMTTLIDDNHDLDCSIHITECALGLEKCGITDDVSHGFRNPDSGDICSHFFLDNSSVLSARILKSEEDIKELCIDQNVSSPNCILYHSNYGVRDDICRKLALADNEKFLINTEDEFDLELCYINEAAEDLDLDLGGQCFDDSRPDLSSICDIEVYDPKLCGSKVEEDILSRQAFLEMKAKHALALVQPTVDRLLKSEAPKMKSAFSDFGELPGSVSDISGLRNRQKLEKMTVTELQIIANNLSEHFEALNHQLMVDLLQRDDLHMVQDSMLVEIEDLTGRAREFASEVDRKKKNSQNAKFK